MKSCVCCKCRGHCYSCRATLIYHQKNNAISFKRWAPDRDCLRATFPCSTSSKASPSSIRTASNRLLRKRTEIGSCHLCRKSEGWCGRSIKTNPSCLKTTKRNTMMSEICSKKWGLSPCLVDMWINSLTIHFCYIFEACCHDRNDKIWLAFWACTISFSSIPNP